MNLEKYFQKLSNEGCSLCSLNKDYNLVGYRGKPESPLMIIGQNPGAQEMKAGIPFIGKSGKLLQKQLEQSGLDKYDPYITNVGLCGTPGNRKLTESELIACSTHLKFQLNKIKPKAILAVGMSPMNELCPETVKVKGKDLLDKPFKNKYGYDTYYIWHTSYLLQNGKASPESDDYQSNVRVMTMISGILNLA